MSRNRLLLKRIQSVQWTQQITKAIQIISQQRLNKELPILKRANLYTEVMDHMLSNLVQQKPLLSEAFTSKRSFNHVSIIGIAGNKGLCGSSNYRVQRALIDHLIYYTGSHVKVDLYLLGDRMIRSIMPIVNKLNYVNCTVYESSHLMQTQKEYTALFENAITQICSDFLNKKTDLVLLCGNLFINRIVQETATKQILPFKPQETQVQDYSVELEESLDQILDLLKIYCKGHIDCLVANSIASDHSSRQVSMKSASEVAENMSAELLLTFSKMRQANITQELNEIMLGSEN